MLLNYHFAKEQVLSERFLGFGNLITRYRFPKPYRSSIPKSMSNHNSQGHDPLAISGKLILNVCGYSF